MGRLAAVACGGRAWSRRGVELIRYLPDLTPVLVARLPADVVIDGELVAWDAATGRLDFPGLQARLAAGTRIKVVYTVADFHNPSGGVLPGSERARLVDLAERYGFVALLGRDLDRAVDVVHAVTCALELVHRGPEAVIEGVSREGGWCGILLGYAQSFV